MIVDGVLCQLSPSPPPPVEENDVRAASGPAYLPTLTATVTARGTVRDARIDTVCGDGAAYLHRQSQSPRHATSFCASRQCGGFLLTFVGRTGSVTV